MPHTLRINEIFHSIQGESTWVGSPCLFIRLTGCHLRCRYCDTEYAFTEGRAVAIDDIVAQAADTPTPLVEITGGEPLLQPRVHELITRLCDLGKTVLIETSGACDISTCDPRAIRILDLKTPGSGEVDRNDLGNLQHLTERDEVKFVVTDRADYEWARDMIQRERLDERCRAVLLSPVHTQPAGDAIPGMAGLDPAKLSAWVLEDAVPARVQIQLHKLIWDPQMRGV